MNPHRLDRVARLLEKLHLMRRKGLIRRICQSKMRRQSLQLHIGQRDNAPCHIRRILRSDADASHPRLDLEMHLDRLTLPYRFLRQSLNEIHLTNRLRDIIVDNLARTLCADQS